MKKRITPVLLGQKGTRKNKILNRVLTVFKNGAVTVSDTNAKQIVRLVDRLVARSAGKSPLESLRYLYDRTGSEALAKQIVAYGKIALPKRKSGFSKLSKVAYRDGDHTLMTKIELIDFVKPEKKTIVKNAPAKSTPGVKETKKSTPSVAKKTVKKETE